MPRSFSRAPGAPHAGTSPVSSGLRFGRLAFALGAIACAPAAFAVLPPHHHNANDLGTLVAFAHQHPDIMASLERIDLRQRQIRFGDGCIAQFKRPPSTRIGPAPALELDYLTCAVKTLPAAKHKVDP